MYLDILNIKHQSKFSICFSFDFIRLIKETEIPAKVLPGGRLVHGRGLLSPLEPLLLPHIHPAAVAAHLLLQVFPPDFLRVMMSWCHDVMTSWWCIWQHLGRVLGGQEGHLLVIPRLGQEQVLHWSWLIEVDPGWFWLFLVDLGWCCLILVDLDWSWLILVNLGWSWLIFVDLCWSWLIFVDLGCSWLILVDIVWSSLFVVDLSWNWL